MKTALIISVLLGMSTSVVAQQTTPYRTSDQMRTLQPSNPSTQNEIEQERMRNENRRLNPNTIQNPSQRSNLSPEATQPYPAYPATPGNTLPPANPANPANPSSPNQSTPTDGAIQRN